MRGRKRTSGPDDENDRRKGQAKEQRGQGNLAGLKLMVDSLKTGIGYDPNFQNSSPVVKPMYVFFRIPRARLTIGRTQDCIGGRMRE